MTSRSPNQKAGPNGKMTVSRTELRVLHYLTLRCLSQPCGKDRWGPVLLGVPQVCTDLDEVPQVLMAVVGSLKQKGYIAEWKAGTSATPDRVPIADVWLTAAWHAIYAGSRDRWLGKGGCQPLADVYAYYTEMETGHPLLLNTVTSYIHNDIARWHAGLPPFARLCFEEACSLAGYAIQQVDIVEGTNLH